MMGELLKVIRYETRFESMAEHLGCDVSEVEDKDGTWIWGDWAGGEHSMSMKEAIPYALSREVWGWSENKDTVHIWFGKNVDPKKLLEVIAHEVGHTCRPYHRGSFKEERKASRYEEVAGTAYEIMSNLLESDDGSG